MGRVRLWYNRGTTANYQVIDGLRFADIDGDGVSPRALLNALLSWTTAYISQRDDYIALDRETGAART